MMYFTYSPNIATRVGMFLSQTGDPLLGTKNYETSESLITIICHNGSKWGKEEHLSRSLSLTKDVGV